MKPVWLFLLILGRLLAQNAVVNPIIGNVYEVPFNEVASPHDHEEIVSGDVLIFQITRAENGDKTFTFFVKHCVYGTFFFAPGLSDLVLENPKTTCTPAAQSVAQTYGLVGDQISEFLNDDSMAPHHIVYANPQSASNLARLRTASGWALSPDLTTEQPAAPLNPKLIFLDGLGNSLVSIDLTSFAVVGQVVVPSTVGPFGIRPTVTGSSNEVWVANGGLEVSVADLGTQKLITNIPISSIPVAVQPAAIVFTNDGETAFEAVKYSTPDSSGNQGALVVFYAVNRKVTSTLLLKSAPTALLMAPDGLTAYLLSSTGTITYYDVLSGTADLSASTYTPGSNGGYPGAGSRAFIHPDGTRLFWNVGTQLEVFDLATRKVINQFSSGLPTTSAASIQMSQDGSQIFFGNGLGNNVVMDTLHGNILATFDSSGASLGFIGPAGN